MQLNESEALDILKRNSGFSDPTAWLSYAIQQRFKLVRAVQRTCCADCGSKQFTTVGTYVYYSTLMTLRRCLECSLVGADTVLDPAVIQEHFESHYKSEEYFQQERKAVFEQVSELVATQSAPTASVLDIGGAKGHLLAAIRTRLPEASLVLNDLSESACAYAKDKYQVRTIPGPAAAIHGECFDAVLLIDVLYYEPQLAELWTHLAALVRPGGLLVVRVPNRHALLSLNAALGTLRARWRGLPSATSISNYNPEHLYVFSQGYLRNRLTKLGFSEIRFVPAAQLKRHGLRALLAKTGWYCADLLARASGGTVVATPSMIVTAKRS